MKTNSGKKIIIIGAGPGGLSAGMLLAHRGFNVEIFEKESLPGGRSGSYTLNGYKFDIGPTFFMMDFVAREIFKEVGRNLDDYVKFTRLSPMYQLIFSDKKIEMYEEDDKMLAEITRVFPGQESGLLKFNKNEKKRFEHLYPILAHHNNNIFDALRLRFLRSLPSFAIGRTLFQILGKYFTQDDARLCFTFQSKYLGMSPWECPGAFTMVPYIEQETGVFHIQGGLSEMAQAMAKVVTEEGGTIHYNTKVKEIVVENKKAKGILLEDGTRIDADEVVINADFAYAMNNLMPKGLLKKYSPERLEKKKYSCSIFMLYLGINKQYDLHHHTIVFAKEYKKNVDDIFHGKLTDKDFSLYVRDASKTDPTLAPAGKSALYVLVPMANTQSGINWEERSKIVREQALDILEQRLEMTGIRQAIEVEKMITPTDWERDFNVQYGAVFNLGHQLRQMLWFRPHNKFEEVKNIYLVGGGTHPGSGLPTIYKSGQIVADLISEK